jgi:pimeloyl-ACP methyl ester carboxylesterase
LKSLKKYKWYSEKKMIVAGHSEGSFIAYKIAQQSKNVAGLIYAGGNVMGRMSAIISAKRGKEQPKDSLVENEFSQWKYIVANKNNNDVSDGNSPKSTYDFSEIILYDFAKLKIPVLVTYGTKDASCFANDLLRLQCLRNKNDKIKFKSYIGLEHNFFPVNEKGEINYKVYNWELVFQDWCKWINSLN